MPRYSKKKKRGVAPPRRPPLAVKVTNRPAKRLQWSREQMDAAIRSVMSGSAVSINRAAREHGIPPTTLKDRLSGRVVDGTKPGPKPYLSQTEENELESYLIESCKVGYGKTRRQVKAIAQNVATDKGVLRKTRISDGWWKRFLERHPKLSLRHGDATGHVRMNAMNEENLKHYFEVLKECMEENNLNNHPERIYNIDETGMPLDPKPPKVVAAKGQKKIRYRCSGSKSQITVLGCASGTGQVIPPFIIFDAKQLNHLWTRGEIPGTRYGLSESGWTDQTLFHGWLKEHFLTHAVSGRPLLLLVDGHSSHYNPESIRFAKEHSVIIFCLPPHTTHEAQPLDVSFFGALKTHWGDVCHDFIQSSPGKVITKYNFCELFSKAWLQTCLPETICSGFRRAGIIPFDPDVLLKRVVKIKEKEAGSDSNETQKDPSKSDDEVGTNLSTSQNGNCSVESQPTFTHEEEQLFSRRFEEGYDLHDTRYEQWLRITHSESSFENSFSDVEPNIPLNVDFPASDPSPMPVSVFAQTPPSGSSSNSSSRSFSRTSSNPYKQLINPFNQ